MADDELIDYNEEEDAPAPKSSGKDTKKGHYVGIHTSSFRDFALKPEILRSVNDCGFEHPSEVQHECIPQSILGFDTICQAKSGMGKTAVFVLSTLHQLNTSSNEIQVVVLCNVRELAFQIQREYNRFCKYLPDVKSRVFYGGTNIKTDIEALKSDCPHIVVGTPGRIMDLIQRKEMDVSKCKHFILDECDKMLAELDMRKDVQTIFKSTPVDKQVMMFSATLDDAIRPVCRKFCQDPMEILIDDDSKLQLHGLLQYYVKLDEGEKNRKLNDILDQIEFNQVVIFVSKVARCKELAKLLEDCMFPTICIHAGLKQEERIERFKQFKEMQKRILVTTDLFGRGIDIEKVNVVFNYDFPDDSDQYLHRVGRAGRFGTKGFACSFISTEEDQAVFDKVQSRFAVKVPELPDQMDSTSYM